MRKTKTSCEVKDRWNRNHYDQIAFRCGIGGKAAINALAQKRGMSTAEYLRHLVIRDALKDAPDSDIQAILGGGGVLKALKYWTKQTALETQSERSQSIEQEQQLLLEDIIPRFE